VQHQKEIKTIIDHCPKKELVELIENIHLTTKRSMLLYKWYGFNIENQYSCPLFHQNFKHILTIGISAFNKQTQTTQHFGWLRAGIRVLINIDEHLDPGAYIDVNNKRHVWCTDGPVFIFDDTVLHQSFNLTDKNRNCLFIDIVRPSPFPALVSSFIKFLGWLSVSLPFISKTSRWQITR
jgi:beta-hydroxylase